MGLRSSRASSSRIVSSPPDRPHQLLLTGDQIYADDVADGLLLMLMDASETLLGWSETLAQKPDGPAKRLADWPSYHRILVLSTAGFTSDDLKSHLMSLGEFLSMYLFVWSDVVWPKDVPMPTFADVRAAVLEPITSSPQRVKDAITGLLETKRHTIEEELRYVAELRSTLPSVRRALANIPTYMMCDDHEVTDDWNMTRRFCEGVYGTSLGRRVVQNALVAFSVCQAWGNAPERFAAPATPGAAILANLEQVGSAANSGAGVYEDASLALQTLVGVHPPRRSSSRTGECFTTRTR